MSFLTIYEIILLVVYALLLQICLMPYYYLLLSLTL